MKGTSLKRKTIGLIDIIVDLRLISYLILATNFPS